MQTVRKAIALISGGLDSMLAAKLIMDQGVHVEGINFFTGFCVEGHTHAIRKQNTDKPKRNNALWVADQLGIKLHIIDVIEPYKQVVLNPKHGYGQHLNPCLDCKGFMVGQALAWIQANGFDFIITGEVIGQRPMSQRRDTMPVVQRESGAGDLLLRPLCASKLPPTRPEREGWVDRDKLLDFHGRSRKPQIALAKQFGIDDYAQPAGGCCFLTDAAYAKKLADLWQWRGDRDYDLDDIMLLKVGRHIRARENFKIIISREEGETHYLHGYRHQYIAVKTTSHPGPLALLDGNNIVSDDIQLAAAIVARYGKGRDAALVDLEVSYPDGRLEHRQVQPLPATQMLPQWHL